MIASIGWRDLLMVLLGLGAIPLTIYSAYYGLLAYCGLSFLRPQSMVFSSMVSETRFTFFVGIALIFRAIISPGPRFRLKAPTLMFIAFWVWMLFCTVLSDYQEGSWEFLEKFSKIGMAIHAPYIQLLMPFPLPKGVTANTSSATNETSRWLSLHGMRPVT